MFERRWHVKSKRNRNLLQGVILRSLIASFVILYMVVGIWLIVPLRQEEQDFLRHQDIRPKIARDEMQGVSLCFNLYFPISYWIWCKCSLRILYRELDEHDNGLDFNRIPSSWTSNRNQVIALLIGDQIELLFDKTTFSWPSRTRMTSWWSTSPMNCSPYSSLWNWRRKVSCFSSWEQGITLNIHLLSSLMIDCRVMASVRRYSKENAISKVSSHKQVNSNTHDQFLLVEMSSQSIMATLGGHLAPYFHAI